MKRAILELDDLSKSFGGLRAVADLSFAVKEKTITSLIGGNGAGKTTVFNLVTGYLPPDSGRILFRGGRVDGLPPHRIARTGIARGFQELRLFNRLTAADNVAAAIPGQRGESLLRSLFGGRHLRAENAAVTARSRDLLQGLSLDGEANALAERLSYGQQKLLGLGRLLAAQGELLLLDEPTAGLSPAMVEDFCARARALVAAGKTILLIEHNVEIVMRLSDWVVVMHQGGKIAEGRPDEVRRDVAVMHTYLGTHLVSALLTVERLDAFYGKKQVLFGIDLALAVHSIAAVIGPNGAGKSTVLRAVFGLVPERQGTIRLDGRDISTSAPARNIAAGIAFVPQGARVFRDLTVAENLRMGGYTLSSTLLAERRVAVLQAFPILAERGAQKAGALSGGERQMLAFGMALMLRPRLLMIDEPSIGLAPMLVGQIFDTIARIRGELGTAVLIVEQQAQQILRIADTVFVIRAGRLISHGPVAQYRGADVLREVYLGNTHATNQGGMECRS